jgi:hypothetical protein
VNSGFISKLLAYNGKNLAWYTALRVILLVTTPRQLRRQSFRVNIKLSLKTRLDDVHNVVPDRVQNQVAHRVQLQFAHNIRPMGLSGLHA